MTRRGDSLRGKGKRSDIEKTLIGVLASRDDTKINETLMSLFVYYFNHASRSRLEEFRFIFTGGTYDRLFFGDEALGIPALDPPVRAWLEDECGVIRLHPANEGGVIALSYLISQRHCSIVWPFFASQETHWLRPENLAFMRLCDQWHVKRLMNRGSVMVWFDHEADADANRNLQQGSVSERLGLAQPFSKSACSLKSKPTGAWKGTTTKFNQMTIALIAHDEMKGRMTEFAIDHEAELIKFKTILATGTTGREVAAATSKEIDKRMVRCHSGPKGGDIEIATAILQGKCDIVIFFVDPLKPHPHIEDIRVVFQSCMVKDQVVMITNEMHAREFMSRVVRGNRSLVLYPNLE